MKSVVVAALLCSSLSALAVSPVRESLDVMQSYHPKEVMLSTKNIPAQGTVVVRCEVKLPRFNNEHFTFYVSPQRGDFGQIKEQFFTDKGFVSIPIGSKVYTTNNQYRDAMNSTFFYITRVKQSNEAVVVDLNNMPDGTTANCTF